MNQSSKLVSFKIENLVVKTNEELDWEVLSNTHPRSLVANKKIRKKKGDRNVVYCHEPYAQDLYDAYNGTITQLVPPTPGKISQGQIVGFSKRQAMVDINWREDAIINLDKERSDLIDHLEVGSTVEILIEKMDSREKKPILGSITKAFEASAYKELMESIGTKVAFIGKVEQMIENAGYEISIGGIKCFMPGSLGGMNKLVDFTSLIGQEIYVVPINYSKEKECVVVSHRDYLRAIVPSEVEALKIGDRYNGFVTGTSSHGIFIEFNRCLTGLISIGDMDESTKERYHQGYNPGDPIEFFVKEIIDDFKIVLSTNPIEPSPWETIDSRIKVGDSIAGKVRKITKFGIFVEIEPGIVGLLHKSMLSEGDEFVQGSSIDCIITRIAKDEKKIDLVL